MDCHKALAKQNGVPNFHARDPSPAIRDRVDSKTKAYTPMIELAARQVAQGLRQRPPVFKVVAFSRAGEFSPGTFELVDWITAQYGKLDALVLTRYDHRTTPMKMREFRAAFLDELVCAVASGTAEIIRAVGHHHSPAHLQVRQASVIS